MNKTRVLAAVLIATEAVLIGIGTIASMAASPAVVRSITVYEAGKTIGNLAQPAPYSVMNVLVSNHQANLELIAQATPRKGERILVVSELDQLIITALSDRGVVGHSLPGGYEINDASQEALLRVNGVLANNSRRAVVAIIISETSDGVQMLAQVTASVEQPPGIISAAAKVLWPWGLLAVLVIAAGIILAWRRPRPSSEE